MSKRYDGPMMPIEGIFSLIVDLAKYNGKPLTFPQEWKQDHLATFFKVMVERGFAVWHEPKEEVCQENPTPSSDSTESVESPPSQS